MSVNGLHINMERNETRKFTKILKNRGEQNRLNSGGDEMNSELTFSTFLVPCMTLKGLTC
jgi:hypothetical protein